MFGTHVSSEKGSIAKGSGFLGQYHQVKIAAVGGGLKGICGNGQPHGGAVGGLYIVIHITAPTTEVYLPAITDQKG